MMGQLIHTPLVPIQLTQSLTTCTFDNCKLGLMNSFAPDITPTSYPSKMEHRDEHSAQRYTNGLPEI